MANLYDKALVGAKIVDFKDANLSIGSSAVLDGLSVYTVLPITVTTKGQMLFRAEDHFKRLCDSAKIIGIELPAGFTYQSFINNIRELAKVNIPKTDTFVRASIHVDELVPGTRSRGMHTVLSMFMYGASPIVPQNGARLKTSVWRRIPDFSIPSRAKVNGAYVNSVLAKQDALDSGYDDCILLDVHGHVCELSAANIFIVRDQKIITPDIASDLLEGINRRTIMQLASDLGYLVEQRSVDLTELYIADEVFASGTSAYVAGIVEIDARQIGDGKIGSITKKLRGLHQKILAGENLKYKSWITRI